MKGFFGTKCSDMTVGQTLIYVGIITLLSFTPLAGMLAYEKIQERRNYEED